MDPLLLTPALTSIPAAIVVLLAARLVIQSAAKEAEAVRAGVTLDRDKDRELLANHLSRTAQIQEETVQALQRIADQLDTLIARTNSVRRD